jgi:hypothetical protein
MGVSSLTRVAAAVQAEQHRAVVSGSVHLKRPAAKPSRTPRH